MNMTSSSNKKKTHIVVPNTKGLNESFKNACGKHEIQVYYMKESPSKTFWWLPKTKIPLFRNVLSFTDSSVTGWNVMQILLVNVQQHLERIKEHLKAPFPIYDHCNKTGYTTIVDNFSIVGRRTRSSLQP